MKGQEEHGGSGSRKQEGGAAADGGAACGGDAKRGNGQVRDEELSSLSVASEMMSRGRKET